MPNIDHVNLGLWRVGEMELKFHKSVCYNLIHFIQSLDGVVVSTLAFHAGVQGSIPRMNYHIFNFPFSQSHPSGITKPSSIKLATSRITSPPNAESGES